MNYIQSDKNVAGRPARYRLFIVLMLLAMGLFCSSLQTLSSIASVWLEDPRYSHGMLVPMFSTYLLWHRRGLLSGQTIGPSWWGLLPIAAGAALKLAGIRYNVDWFDAMSLLPSLAGIGLLVGGWPILRWSATAVAYLIFMIPLPFRAEVALGAPLQRLATISSNFALQTLGLPAVAEGNVILLNDAKIGVVEACNGMGMLFMFAALAVGVVLLISRDPLDKMLIILSAAPIALLVNIARITLTGLLHVTAGHMVADKIYHDLAGWLMMPMALAALWLELVVLSHLFIEKNSADPAPFDLMKLDVSGSAPTRHSGDSDAVRGAGGRGKK